MCFGFGDAESDAFLMLLRVTMLTSLDTTRGPAAAGSPLHHQATLSREISIYLFFHFIYIF